MKTNKDIRLADAEAERKRQALINQKRARELFSGFSSPEAFLAAQHLQSEYSSAIDDLERGMLIKDVSRRPFASFLMNPKIQGFFAFDGVNKALKRKSLIVELAKEFKLSSCCFKEIQGFELESGETAHIHTAYIMYIKSTGAPGVVKIAFIHNGPAGLLSSYYKKQGKKIAELNAEQMEFLGVKNFDECHHSYQHNAKMTLSLYNIKEDVDEVVDELKALITPKIKAYKGKKQKQNKPKKVEESAKVIKMDSRKRA